MRSDETTQEVFTEIDYFELKEQEEDYSEFVAKQLEDWIWHYGQ